MSASAAQTRTRIAVSDHVAVVALTRPERHNALDLPMFEAIADAAAQVSSTPGVRAVVLHGDGPSFCSGLDIESFLASGEGASAFEGPALDRRGPREANLFRRVATDWLDVPMPVVAAIHGARYGGGLQIALAADVRIAAPDARLAIMEARWGLVPDMGITQTLPRLLGIDHAKELTYTARRLNGEEALQAGLVTRVAHDPLAAAMELAGEIAAQSPDAVRAAKRLYEHSWPAAAPDALALETQLQASLLGSPNQIAAVVAGTSGQPGTFADPS